ncbi:MAG: iron hydrogenase, partial [Clostridiaceae bacterium]
MTFEELYNRLLKSSVNGALTQELDLVRQQGYDPHHLSCLLSPEKHPVVIRTDACDCKGEQ